jgi:hypothetical protein
MTEIVQEALRSVYGFTDFKEFKTKKGRSVKIALGVRDVEERGTS